MVQLICYLFSLLLLFKSASATVSNASNDSEKCYSVIGCFGSADFADLNGRPITFVPQSPEEINITFKLYTSENPYSSIDFKYNFEQFQLNNSPFNGRKKVKFIIHGFTGSFNEMDWMGGIKDLILEGQPNRYNVFGVDWSSGAKTINYFQAVANTRVVGAAMAHFIKKLKQFSGLKFSDVHLIGHSLGAHAAGYTGERIKNPQIGRITGLDPAGPSFYPNKTSTRLDPTDAYYVDALHTDYGNAVLEGLGLEDPVGDIDFYPNGGYRQPACGKTKGLYNILNQGVIKGITETVSCNHNFAPRLMLVNPESLTENCQFVGYQCSNYEEYEKGKCTDCGKDGKKCAVLSIFGETDRSSGEAFQEQKEKQFRDRAFKKYYYKTGAELPFCLHHYGIEIHLANNSESGTGKFTLDLEGSKRKADGIQVSEAFSSFKPGETYTFLVTYEKSLGPLRRVVMKWSFQGIDVLNPVKLISHPKMAIDRLAIKYMSNIDPRIREEESAILCPEQSDKVLSGSQLVFVPCRGGQSNANQGGVSRFNNGQTNSSRSQQSSNGSSRNQHTTSRYDSGSRYSTTPGYESGSRHSSTSNYYPTTPRYDSSSRHSSTSGYDSGSRYSTLDHHSGSRHSSTSNYYSTTPRYNSGSRHSSTSGYESGSRYSTTPNYHDNNHHSTSNYNPGHHSTSRYQTTPSYPSSTRFQLFSNSNLSPSYRPSFPGVSSWNHRPASPSLWTPDEPMRQYFRPHRVPSFYTDLQSSSSDPRVKLHLGDNVGEIYRNLGERSFFTSALTRILPARVNQKFDEMFKTSTPSLLYSTDLRGEEWSKPIVLASNSRSPGSWRDVPDLRFDYSNNRDNFPLMVKQRSQTNGKVLNFTDSNSSKEYQNQKSSSSSILPTRKDRLTEKATVLGRVEKLDKVAGNGQDDTLAIDDSSSSATA